MRIKPNEKERMKMTSRGNVALSLKLAKLKVIQTTKSETLILKAIS